MVKMTIHADAKKGKINKNIYGHFSVAFEQFTLDNGLLTLTVPPASVIVLTLK